jgi:hypothetical protein
VFVAKIADRFVLGPEIFHAHDASMNFSAMCYNWAIKESLVALQGTTLFIPLWGEKK